jgi:hypothetical protein
MPSIVSVSASSRKPARVLRFAVLVGCGIAVAGCTAGIETVRALRGVNKNDPDPVAAPFAGNMAAAEAAPYPNLAGVPPPPTRATTAAERQKLAERLVAERAATVQAAATPGAANAVQPGAVTGATPAPPQPIPAQATPATDPPIPNPGAVVASNQGDPARVAPRDSELRMPQVRSLPEPDDPRPAPPLPRLRPVLPPEQPPPAAIASAVPQPAPAVPEFAPIAPPAAFSAAGEPPPVAAPVTVAMLDAPDPAQIAQVASRYRESAADRPPRAVRVIAYTVPPAPGADPLGGYHDALERAQNIAKALAAAGIPEKMLQTEAKPAAGPIAASRIEIQFLP